MFAIFDNLRDITVLSVGLRLFLTFLCGALIGLEREFKRRPAGFRTHILICVGAAVTTLTVVKGDTVLKIACYYHYKILQCKQYCCYSYKPLYRIFSFFASLF